MYLIFKIDSLYFPDLLQPHVALEYSGAKKSTCGNMSFSYFRSFVQDCDVSLINDVTI